MFFRVNIKKNAKAKKVKKSDKEAKIKNSKGQTKSKGMKKSLEELKTTDPEFYKFLEKEDQDLLDEDDDDESDMDDLSEDDEEGVEIPEDPDKKRKAKRDAAAKRAFEKEILDMSSGSDVSDDDEDQGAFQPPNKLQVRCL